MEHKPQTSIYNTGKPSAPRASTVEKPLQPAPRELPQPGDDDDDMAGDQAVGAFEDPWLADIRARRVKNFLMLAVTMAVTSAITYFAVRYYDEGRTKPPPPMPTIGGPPPVIVDIEASLQLPARQSSDFRHDVLQLEPPPPPDPKAGASTVPPAPEPSPAGQAPDFRQRVQHGPAPSRPRRRTGETRAPTGSPVALPWDARQPHAPRGRAARNHSGTEIMPAVESGPRRELPPAAEPGAGRELTIEEYAAFGALRAVFPERLAEVLAHHGLRSAEEARRLDATFQARIAAEPALEARYRQLHQHYTSWYRARRP